MGSAVALGPGQCGRALQEVLEECRKGAVIEPLRRAGILPDGAGRRSERIKEEGGKEGEGQELKRGKRRILV